MPEVVEEVLEQMDLEVMVEKVAVVMEEVIFNLEGLLQEVKQERVILEVEAVEQHHLPHLD
jgi:hypothetical protein